VVVPTDDVTRREVQKHHLQCVVGGVSAELVPVAAERGVDEENVGRFRLGEAERQPSEGLPRRIP
jgi:hypothetical protein